ncbi:MAG: 23S rRNA (guanosine(2251)-2'-O)-methyltransferase RlmB [Bacilli bacterium]|nr:23S rRNA (guanosine(2251)-2'-O)-methyltransferase RlmB [Bacilli bacterium]
MMIVFGRNVAREVIDSNKQIKKVLMANTFDDKGIISDLEKNNVKIIRVDKREIDRKYKGNHQGIVLEIEDFKYGKLNDLENAKFVVMLDHLEDPHNLGAIIRTCEAAGVDAIIIPKRRGVEINSTVMKVSAGALNNINIVEVSSIAQTIDKLKDFGFWVYGTDMDGETYTNCKYDSKTCLVIGAEGNGISKLVHDKCDFIISIPMVGKINSLNASVAAGITIYEVVRQRDER